MYVGCRIFFKMFISLPNVDKFSRRSQEAVLCGLFFLLLAVAL